MIIPSSEPIIQGNGPEFVPDIENLIELTEPELPITEEPIIVRPRRARPEPHRCHLDIKCICLSSDLSPTACPTHGDARPKIWRCSGCKKFLTKIERQLLIKNIICKQFQERFAWITHSYRNFELSPTKEIIWIEPLCVAECMRCKVDQFFKLLSEV